ncbi:diguanylate cyclase [Duganella sp. CF517]|uniref:GGDEF domain-containing protein n=1 Tax=Duganella sp. CF517 TaxID=1881038 RepID=UPI0015A5F613|nr:GGDEF domain-containing protein [Duganella sp. CF517]
MRHVTGMLMAVTIGLLIWHHYGMERVIDLSHRNNVMLEVQGDVSSGGSSVATLERGDGVLRLRCRLMRTIDWPSCKYLFVISQTGKGMDLSEFDSVSVDVHYRGPGRHALRLMLMNFEPEVSTVSDWMSQKINELEFEVPDRGVAGIPLNVFHTATWWIDYKRVPLAASGVRMDNVTRVELMTGAANQAGEHIIDLRSLRFHGKWISQGRLYMLLMGAWILCAVSWPLVASLQLRRQLRHSSKRLNLLSEVNRALQLEARELVEQVNTDPLTGALNRQGLRAALMSTPAILAAPMSVVFTDIDHFKHINDQHGHDAGDAVLRQFAAEITAGIRSSDKLVRWGGEEFLIICSGTSAEQARVLAEKLRAGLNNARWPIQPGITASFGIAELTPNDDIGDAIKRADEALYAAKDAGRDRVVVDLGWDDMAPADKPRAPLSAPR